MPDALNPVPNCVAYNDGMSINIFIFDLQAQLKLNLSMGRFSHQSNYLRKVQAPNGASKNTIDKHFLYFLVPTVLRRIGVILGTQHPIRNMK